ncbi:MAG: lipopolysaccharide heptosyltransferase II [Calditrichaeota bacterium]|nr:MAG: lipopolysaccharide heptosyltransferase II [Calditrichota bacterium]
MNFANFNPSRVLIIQTAFIGDVILTLPLLQKVRAIFPNAEVDFLAIPTVENLLENNPDIAQLVIYDKHHRDRGFRAFFSLTRRLRRRQYDLALIPHRSIRSAFLAYCSGIPHRIGFNRSAGKFLFTRSIPYPRGVHESTRNLHLLKPFGVDPFEKIFPQLYFDDVDMASVREWIADGRKTSNFPMIAMAPGSVWNTKRWPPEYYTELAKKLIQEGFRVVLVGGSADREVADKISHALKDHVLNAVGEFTLRQSAYIIKLSHLLITNDSAPLHMGVAVGTPVVAIFGPTVKDFGFYPYGALDQVVELDGLKCRPCGVHGGNKCPINTFECMINLKPDMVFSRVSKVLNLLQGSENKG